ncbi:hypothetical protein [Poseidonibacter ostreae]|uniref:Uncharacterized protein n=1 Tax=Poseidonibacter ostreae TaxID=2654171 RepID=A0A6L4WWQ7_9BACT|nr:hypothetical protein [Poseidonibacter ostreae]KAB7891275.1 hypothetical protein GBG19_00130 [Poseidonibacter ostreae]
MKIQKVDFTKFIINMEKNNAVELQYIDSDKEENSIDIGKYVAINIADEVVDIKIKDSDKQFIKADLNTYSKSLLFLVKDVQVKQVLKEYFSKEENFDKEYFVLESKALAMIGEKISTLDVKLNILDEVEKQKDIISKTDQKNNLKAYETPTNMFDIAFSLMQKSVISSDVLTDTAMNYKYEISESLKLKMAESKDDKALIKELKKTYELISSKKNVPLFANAIESFYSETRKHYFETIDNPDYKLIRDYIIENNPTLVSTLEEMSKSDFPYTVANSEMMKNVSTLPIIDLQAGSGEAILNSSTKNGLDIQLQGLEYRSKTDMGLDEDTLDNRYKVETSSNFNVYKNDLRSAFRNGKNFKAVLNTPVHLNPPYNADNQIAKESIDVLADKQFVFGLFPTSMKNFLAERLDGFVFEVNKELTGYKQEEVPEKLLYVIGRRYEDEVQLENGSTAKLSMNRQKHTFLRNIASSNVSDAIKEISKEINMNKDKFPFTDYINNMNSYFTMDNKRVDMVFRTIKDNMEKTNSFINNSSLFFEALEQNSDYIRSQFGSENMLLKEKVFPNVQFYEQDGKKEYLRFADVISNQGLLVSYRDNYPEILNLVKKIADKEGLEVNMNESFTSLYDLSNPHVPEKKDKKVSENIGLMKNYYLPSSFDISSKENKEHLMAIFEDVFKEKEANFDVHTKARFEKIIGLSTKLVTKLETKIRDEKSVLKDELFVLLDEDGVDVGKLNVSKTDFYKSLENLNYFNIDNYVELAELQDSKKEIVMENFLKHLKNSIFLLDKYNESTNCETRIFQYLSQSMALSKKQKANAITSSEYATEYNTLFVDFAKEFKVFDYFNSFVNYDSRLLSKFEKIFIKNEYLIDLNIQDKADIASDTYELYSHSPLNFFEYQRAEIEESIEKLVQDKLEANNLPPLEAKQLKFIKIDIYNSLSQDFVKRKSIFEAGIRLSKLLVMNYGYATLKKTMSAKQGKEISYAKLYNELFDSIAMNTLGLMPHQHHTSERFLEISEDVKLDMKMWEMRSGKTLGFTQEMYLLSLFNSKDAFMLLESKNIDDITLQIMSHLPHLFMNTNFYLTESKMNDAVVSPSKAYNHLPQAEYYPNLPTILKPFYTGRGDMTKDEISVYAVEFEQLMETVNKKEIDKQHILDNYGDSKFLDILEVSCMKNA